MRDASDNMTRELDTQFPGQCEGTVRVGGAFTMGMPYWVRCLNPGIAIIKVRGQEPMPCCSLCWRELIEHKLPIEDVGPVPEGEPLPEDYQLIGQPHPELHDEGCP